MIRQLIKRGALFIVNHSAGKDSQCMFIRLARIIPRHQLIVIHADLGEVEWPGNIEHIKNTIGKTEFHVCRNRNKTFLEMVERRGQFPDASRRQCTSDLKRDPISSQIKAICKEKGNFLVVNCMGIRADESTSRAKLQPFKLNTRYANAKYEWYDWLPIHSMTTSEVFATIAAAGQKPHWAYEAGMSRLSCSFCIMASKSDLCTAARLRPELYKKYVELEIKIGHTLQMSKKTLPEITGIGIGESDKVQQFCLNL